MKTKGADDSNCGIDELFFAEVTINHGEHIEMVVSCFDMVKPSDNGIVLIPLYLNVVPIYLELYVNSV